MEEKAINRTHSGDVLRDSLSPWLKALLNRLGLSQEAFGRVAGMAATSVQNYTVTTSHRFPMGPKLLRILLFATPQEREALLDRARAGLDDYVRDGEGAKVMCRECSQPMRLHEFAHQNLELPPAVVRSIHQRRVCARCMEQMYDITRTQEE